MENFKNACARAAAMPATIANFTINVALLLLLFVGAAQAQEKQHPIDPLPPVSCLSGKAEVTCGKVQGTFVITLQTQGNGGVKPDVVSITPVSAGVTILNPQISYPVINGQVKFIVAGAQPGDTIAFDIEGTVIGAGPVEGSDICCNGTIKVEIPKDLPCEKSTVDVTKVCEPARYRKYPLGPAATGAGFVSMCHITVITTGPQNGTLSVTDQLSGGGTLVSASSTTSPAWTCGATGCAINGGQLNQTTSTSMIDVMVVFPTAGHVSEARNCALVAVRGKPVDKDCVRFPEEGKVDISKVCAPATLGKYPVNEVTTGLGYRSQCTITVTTTGPQAGTLSVNENMIGGTVLGFNSTSAPAWSCASPACSINGSALNQTSSTSTFTASVVFPNNPGAVAEAKNCAAVAADGALKAEACTPFVVNDPKEPEVTINKVCEPARKMDTPVLQLGAKCTITVTTIGPIQSQLVVKDILTGSGQITSFINTSTPAWTCSAGQCDMDGSNLNQTTSTSTFDAFVTFPPGQGAEGMEAKNCAILGRDAHPVGESCADIKVEDPKVDTGLSIKKVVINNAPQPVTGMVFTIKNTCSNDTTVSGLDNLTDGQTKPFHIYMPGVTCTVQEQPIPATTACGFLLAQWTTTYLPSQTVALAPGGTLVTVQNTLNCVPIFNPTPSTQTISKVCEPATEVVGAINAYQSLCHITVTTTGPQSGTMAVNDNLVGGGTITSITGPAPWACTGTGCTADGGLLNQTASTSVIDAVVSFPSSGHALESQNCAELAVGQNPVPKPDGESCTKFTVDPQDTTRISITKKVEIAGPANLAGIQFPISYDCGAGAQTISLANGETHIVNGLQAGASCTVQEGPITANPCGNTGTSATTANWLAPIYQPSQTVVAGPGASVTVINRVMCEDIKPAKTVTITKRVVSNAPDVLPSVAYPVTATCDANVTSINEGQTISIGNLAAGTACTITEGPLTQGIVNNAALDACGGAGTPVWTTSYAPSQTVNAGTGANVTITNTLDCKRIDDPIDNRMYIKKVVVNNAPGSLEGVEYDITSQCTNTTQPTGFAHFSDGETVLFHNYEAGMSCNLSEVIPATTACGKGMRDVWSTTYSPSQTVNLSPNGETITVTNTLNCESVNGDGLTTFTVRKEATQDGNPITSVSFPMTVTCGEGAAQSIMLTGGQSQTFGNLADGTTCEVIENKFDNTGLCPEGTIEQWATTYNPANGQNTTSTLASAIVTVRNELTCAPIVNPVETGTLTIIKEALFKGQHITNQNFTMDLTCGNNAQQVQVADGAPYVQTGIPAGTDCDVSETPAPVPALCAQGQTGSWKTTYAPNESVTVPASGATITVTNLLECKGVVTPSCPPLTFWNGNICMPNCPPLTAWDGNFCKPTCPPLTEWDGNFCKPTCPPLTAWDGNFCKPTCPPLTTWNGTLCQPDCPPLTAWDGNFCKPTCPPLTTWNGTLCQPNCPPLTDWNGTLCQPNCPPLTQWNGSICAPKFPFKVGEPTSEDCKPGFALKEGKGCVPIVVTPKCDPATTVTKGNSCVCEYKNMVQVSKTACACTKGLKFAAGKGCFRPEPVCKNGERYQPERKRCEPVCAKGLSYSIKRNTCFKPEPVCKKGTVFNAKRNRCESVEPVCRPPFKYDPKRNACVEQIRRCEPGTIPFKGRCIPVAKCPRGQVPIPGTPICVSIGGGGGPKEPIEPRGPKRPIDPPRCNPAVQECG